MTARRTATVRLTVTVDVDMDAYADAYGQTPEEARADVLEHLPTTAVHHLSQTRLEWIDGVHSATAVATFHGPA